MSAIVREEALGYWDRIKKFTPNARKLILSNILRAFGWGITQTLFNIYLLSLGYSFTFLGTLMSLSAITMAIASLLLGPYVSRVGSRNSLVLGSLISVIVAFNQVAFPVPEILLTASILQGTGSAILNISYSPFMTKHSTAYERTHLFGTSQSAQIISAFISNTLAGFLPLFFALAFALPLDSAPTFQLTLFLHIIPLTLSIFPILAVREFENNATNTIGLVESDHSTEPTPIQGKKNIRRIALQFAIINIFIGLGAGFVIPYLNVFFWDFYNLPTHMVGIVQGLGSLSVAIGVFLSPVLSTRIGKVKTVIATQGMSLPFLLFIATIINPYVAITSYILRVVLMNMAGPVDNTLRMEMVPESFRANMSAISSFAWNFPWAISTRITGPLFDLGLYLLPFWFTLSCYGASTILYAIFFRHVEKGNKKESTEYEK